MNSKVLRSIALMAVVVPGFAAAQTTFTDTTTYVVQPQKYPYITYSSGYMLDDHYPWESTVAPFNPDGAYSVGQQNAIVQDELARTGGTLSFDPTDYSNDISVVQPTIMEASQHLVPAPTEIMPWMTPAGTFNKTYSRVERFGNNIFGAGYSINATITAETATSTAEKRVDAMAEGKVVGTAFNNEKELVRGRAQISGQQGGANSGTAALYAMGQEIWSTNLYATYEPTPINWSRTFFSVSKRFMVGPVPIKVAASLAGGVRLTVKGIVGPTVARITATPGGWSNVTASASVDIVVFSFGLQGSLSLINANLPSVGELFWPICTLDWTIKSNLELNTLSGTLKLFARIKFLFFKKTWWVTIAEWSGITRNWSLINLTGSQPLGICG